jgi:hypothetical protein
MLVATEQKYKGRNEVNRVQPFRSISSKSIRFSDFTKGKPKTIFFFTFMFLSDVNSCMHAYKASIITMIKSRRMR